MKVRSPIIPNWSTTMLAGMLVTKPLGLVWIPFLAWADLASSCSGVSWAALILTESKTPDWSLNTKLAGAPGNAGKSSLDIWNSEECSDGCFTIPTHLPGEERVPAVP